MDTTLFGTCSSVCLTVCLRNIVQRMKERMQNILETDLLAVIVLCPWSSLLVNIVHRVLESSGNDIDLYIIQFNTIIFCDSILSLYHSLLIYIVQRVRESSEIILESTLFGRCCSFSMVQNAREF